MNDLRAAAQQALEALEDAKALLNNKDRTTTMWFADEITALRAALAQQDEPVEPVAWLAPDGSVRETTAAKSFGEWVWGPDDFKPLYTAPPRCPTCASLEAQQDEPLNLRDPAVRKRLATQWGYVPAAQAEPVEPVATLIAQRDALLEALKGLMQQYKDQPECFMDWSKARAAIKAVEETK